MLENFRRERAVRKALRAIARQRALMFVGPERVMVVENGTPDAEWFDVAVQTCLIRGWIDVLHDSFPSGTLGFRDDGAPIFPEYMPLKSVYKLTEGGWAALNRSHAWVISTFIIALVTLVVTIAPFLVALLATIMQWLHSGSA